MVCCWWLGGGMMCYWWLGGEMMCYWWLGGRMMCYWWLGGGMVVATEWLFIGILLIKKILKAVIV